MRTIGIVGAGRLGATLIRAMARFAPELALHAASRDAERLERLRREVPRLAVGSPEEVARAADLLFLAVPPEAYPALIVRVAPALGEHAVLASVTNAVPLEAIAAQVPVAVIKVIPTLAQAVGRGVTLLVAGPGVRRDQLDAVRAVLVRFSVPVPIDPADDRVASNVAGSALALVAAMAESFVASNLARARALDQAALDAMMAETLQAIGALVKAGHSFRDIVEATATPGGMTEAALAVLARDFPRLAQDMVEATFSRQRALRSQPS